MTLSQKILCDKSNRQSVQAGELISASLDGILGNDITAPIAISAFDRMGFTNVFDPERIYLVLDHFTPCKDIQSAKLCQTVREFATRFNLPHLYDVGEMGIEHALLPEKGLVRCGDLIIGADSHTCTYGALGAFATGVGSTDMTAGLTSGHGWFRVPTAIKVELRGKPSKRISGKDIILHLIGQIGVDGARYQSIEFSGDGITYLSMDDRFTICNMVIEAGAKNGIFPIDEQTIDYLATHPRQGAPLLKTHAQHAEKEIPLCIHTNLDSNAPKIYNAFANRETIPLYTSDSDADYDKIITIDLSTLEPTIAMPHLPSNIKTISECGDITIQQVVIGSCTNGRLSDLASAASVLKDQHVAKGVRCLIIPATNAIYLAALKAGYITTFIEAGAVVSTPTCGCCLGGHMGILGENEKCVSTTNRNFVGRMGHRTSEVYLASPLVAASSAIAGKIACIKL